MNGSTTELLREGTVLLVMTLAPAAGAAAGAALTVGWLMHRLGVSDPTPVLVVRAAAVVAVIGWFAVRWFVALVAWTRGLWSGLPALGRGEAGGL